MSKFMDYVTKPIDWTLGLLNNRWARKQSEKNTKMTIQANKELAQFAWEKDVEMWNRQNLYNDPRSQMERLKNAGLNPNLVYGQGAVGNQSGPPPSYQAPNVDYGGVLPQKIPHMIDMFQNFEMRQAQIDNVKENTKNTKERTNNEKLAQLMGLVNYDVAKGTSQYQKEAARLNNKKLEKAIAAEVERIKNLQVDEKNKHLQGLLIKAQTDKAKGEKGLLDWKNRLRDQNITDTDNVLLRQLLMLFENEINALRNWKNN